MNMVKSGTAPRNNNSIVKKLFKRFSLYTAEFTGSGSVHRRHGLWNLVRCLDS